MIFRYSSTDAQGLCAPSSLYQCELSKTKQSIALGNPSHYKNKKDQDNFLTEFSEFLEKGSREFTLKASNNSNSFYQVVGDKIIYIVNFLRKYRDSNTREWPPKLPLDKWMDMGYNLSVVISLIHYIPIEEVY